MCHYNHLTAVMFLRFLHVVIHVLAITTLFARYIHSVAFGTLHSLNNFKKWAAKEELIVEALIKRQNILTKELDLIRKYLEDYNETSGKAILHLHDHIESRPTTDKKGKTIGSSAVLGHRMASRYSSHLTKLRALLQTSEVLENEMKVYDVLSLDDDEVDNIFQMPVINVKMKEAVSTMQSTATSGNEEDINPNEEDTHHIDYEEAASWPNWRDKYMSTLAFLHIHEVYGFNPSDVREGLKVETPYGGSLNALHCAEIGMFALYRGFYYMAIEWLELAKSLLKDNENHDTSISTDLVSSMLKVAIQEHNLGLSNKSRDFENYYTDYTYEGEPMNRRMRGRKQLYLWYGGLGPYSRSHAQFLGLCSGHMYQTPKLQADLKCYYEDKRHPYLYINPVKSEVLSISPPVIQFYDILGNKTIEGIKRIMDTRLHLSQLVGVYNLEDITEFRTSAGASLSPDELPNLNLIKLSEFVSGLKINGSSEPAQALEYTYGRYYTYHSDALESGKDTFESVEMFGDRVATMLFYLEIPDHGGKTPFCSAGVSANQVRGSAILWFNLYRNGTARKDVDHGACPVIHGHKQVVNYWIRYKGNWNTYKCSLNQYE